MTTPVAIQYFLVTNPLAEAVETNTTAVTGTLPTIAPISGIVTFTPCDAKGNPMPEIISVALDETLMIDPVQGRFNNSGVLCSLNGVPGVSLVDNVNLGLLPGGLTYRFDYSKVVFDGANDRKIQSGRFTAPGDGSGIDLNTVTRLP